MTTPCLMAQKTTARTVRQELSQARSYVKSRKNFDKAEQLMTHLLADTANSGNKRIYVVWLDAVKGQYDQANERFYVGQKQDTAAFFALTRRMFTVATKLDSIDALPDKRGRVKPAYRQKNAAMLHNYRPNLYNAGTYFIRKEQWQQAFDFIDTYIRCASQPLFANYNYTTNDHRLPDAAYWATYAAYRLHNANLTLRYNQMALADTVHAAFTLQFTAEAHKWLENRGSYVATLQQGFHSYPLFPYFFPRLIDAYTVNAQYNDALLLADSALQVCDTCQLFLLAKSSTLLRMRRMEESIEYSKRILQLNDSMPEACLNAATAYAELAAQYSAIDQKTAQREYYQRARTYAESYRALMPHEKNKWGPLLYRIYLNLNLGRQFDEIDSILNKP